MRRTHTLLILFTALAARAQDKILMMNGQVIEGEVIGQSTLEIRYLTDKGKKRVERSEPTESVFSVTDRTGKERLWYFHDTIFGNDLEPEQMRWFIKGEQDARDGYKPLIPMIGGFALGAGLTIGFDMEVMSLLIPPVYAGTMALPRVHVTKGSIRDPLMEGDEYYATGYARVGRTKRVVRSLISSAAGVLVGLGVRQLIINPNLPDP
ncbi:MAG: hypothetical protein KDB88_00655 [Flavobacteriales bacterium]|nr:hypothetical protein [Flavobacteriales bacterium]